MSTPFHRTALVLAAGLSFTFCQILYADGRLAWQSMFSGDPSAAPEFRASLALGEPGWDLRLDAPFQGNAPGSIRWLIRGPRLSLGTPDLPLRRALLAGSLSALASLPVGPGAAPPMAGGFGLAPAGTAAPLGMGLSPFDGLDAWALMPDAAAGSWRAGLAGTIGAGQAGGDGLWASLAWSQAGDSAGDFRAPEGDDWWITRPNLVAARVAHLQALAGSRLDGFTVRAFLAVSLPHAMAPGCLGGLRLELAGREKAGRPGPSAVDGITVPGMEAPEDEAAPSFGGRWRLALAGRACSPWYVDDSGAFPSQPLVLAVEADWLPLPWLAWRNALGFELGRYPRAPAAGGTPERPCLLDARGSLQLADRTAGLRLGWELAWRRGGGGAWSQATGLTLRLGLSPGREGREEGRGTLDGSLDLVDGQPSALGLACAGTRSLRLGKGSLEAGFKAGIKAPAGWWAALPGGAPPATGACELAARLTTSAELASAAGWRLGLSAEGGLEEASAASDWTRWPRLLGGRVGFTLVW
jgi:hypothetical protein